MFKTTIALVLLSSLAVAAPGQRGRCGQNQDCRKATTSETQEVKKAQPAEGMEGRRRGQQAGKQQNGKDARRGKGMRKGKGKRRGGGCQDASANKGDCGQTTTAKKKMNKKGKQQGKGIAKKANASKGNCAESNCGQGKKGQRGKRAGNASKGCSPSGDSKGMARQTKAIAGETTAFKLPEGVTAKVAKEWVAKLQPVLEAELYAQEYYEAASKALNGVRRFQNLARAEGNHANAISNAIVTMGGTPDKTQPTAIVIPKTIEAADKHCEEVELHVIDIYKGLIKTAPTSQMKSMFENIQRANMRHLNAVQ